MNPLGLRPVGPRRDRPVQPADALRRIAYLLERDGAESYKVRAFRNAAAAIADVPDGELTAMTPARLQKIPGVGKTSAQVIVEAVGGGTPGYLEKLESATSPAMSDEAAKLFGLLQGDCHSHSDWSDGGSPIREMAEAAMEIGHRYWALTDHSPRLTIAHGLDADRLRQSTRHRRRTERRACPVSDPHRDRSRHPRGWIPRPGR